ncbi:MAG: hypothetical protein HC883_01285 [Bdellovibrionaceae bacterium]|nr:hypothetical protein [Pseudobdellovibrionaceae bacterium]
MKSILFILLASVLTSVAASASAMEVSLHCTPKAYSCLNGPKGPECSWAKLGRGFSTTVPLTQDLNNPDVWRGRYQDNIDGHILTLNFRFNENGLQPLRVDAYLAVSNVLGETTGTNSVEIALRNNVYGRGFNCKQIRVLQ